MSLIVDIKKRVKGFTLDVDFSIQGDYLGLLGSSGSGKSMTLKCIAGVERPDQGRIILNGKILFDSEKNIDLKPQDRNIGFLFQNYALFPHMTVEENIGIGLDLPKEDKSKRVNEMIQAFHLQGLEKKHPNKISGGQQQRVALARAIIYNPEILMLDEPFSALDSHLKEQLQNGMLRLLEFYKGEIIMVSHSRDEIYRFCNKLAIIDGGKNILFGDTKEIFRNPRLSSAARLIGCQNIFECEISSSNSVYVKDWNITLHTEENVTPNTKYVGVRAEDFKIIENNAGNKTNVISCKIDRIVEDVSQYHIYLNNEILFKVNKEEWEKRKNKEKLYLQVPEDVIFLLKGL